MLIDALTGFTPTLLFVFGGLLLIMTVGVAHFDVTELRIPNVLNAALFICGLVQLAFLATATGRSFVTMLGVGLGSSILTASVFFLVREVHYRLRGKVGLGLGDVKMAGALAPWVHPANISLVILAACLGALIYVLFAWRTAHFRSRSGSVPFGAFLGLGLVIIWVFERVST